MPKIPKAIAVASDEEVLRLRGGGKGAFLWQLPEELFDGRWFRLEVDKTEVSSLGNGYRAQARLTYGKRAEVRLANGAVYVRMLVDTPYIAKREGIEVGDKEPPKPPPPNEDTDESKES